MNLRKKVKEAKRFLAVYLALLILIESLHPTSAYALTEGPTQPEFNSFTPIGTSDMVDLTTGDFNYNIPIMDVGGYPINLAYNSGVTMDQEASWVGLGWNLNIGQINRNVRGIPDDFKGDEIHNENNLKKNVTVSISPYVNPQAFGVLDNKLKFGLGVEVKYNNYKGLSANPSFGASFDLSKNVSLGLQLSTSDDAGATVSPSISAHTTSAVNTKNNTFGGKLTAGLNYNSRQGLSNFNLSSSTSKNYTDKNNNQRSSSLTGGSAGFNLLNNSFTPNKRISFENNQFIFSFSTGGSVFGFQGEVSIAASATVQRLKNKIKDDKSFGYDNSEFAGQQDIMDFNRENDPVIVTQNTTILPVTSYTYDLLNIQSQGMSGTIRPYRSQAGYVFDPLVSDNSNSASASLELEAGWGVHTGGGLKYTSSNNYTTGWNTVATPYLKEKNIKRPDYEKVYYKNVGEQRVDADVATNLGYTFGGNKPIALKLSNQNVLNQYYKKVNTPASTNYQMQDIKPFNTDSLQRRTREQRNKVIQKITKAEANSYGLSDKFIKLNSNAKNHHTAGFLITDENGNRNIFGEAVYNIEKNEVSFATDASGSKIDTQRGIVNYLSNENTIQNTSGIDHYFNKVRTPAYAHSYLISSVLSADYQDVTSDGPTDDDLGSYTKFTYVQPNKFRWRVPFNRNEASYNEGFKTAKKDQKGSYLYGEKEVKYINRIETKTHIAIIKLKPREDGFGVANENGGLDQTQKSYCIETIKLYVKKANGNYTNQELELQIPIKTAHFEYDYSLCKKIDNNQNTITNNNPLSGKLTLKKVYFTYQNSNMGRYTPYIFNYSDINPDYNPKNYDIWGNYKENKMLITGLSPQDFPFVEQNSQADINVQNQNASAWTLKEVLLPSGGKIAVSFESDDYQYVQNKKAMKMYKVAGVSTTQNVSNIQSSLYGLGGDANFVAIELGEENSKLKNNEILNQLRSSNTDGPIYFDFFLNMTKYKKDHITGYFELNGDIKIEEQGVKKYLFVPMKKIPLDGTSGSPTNPISVTGMFFGRENLSALIYGFGEPSDDIGDNLVQLAKSFLNSIGQITELFIGANGRLQSEFGCAKTFDPSKSWIRLNDLRGRKMGGGCRVKKVEMFDQWNQMIGSNNVIGDVERYKKKYGQEYNYELDNKTSSGVATFEPNNSKENPLVKPLYSGSEKLSAAKYEEGPFGASFFPSPTVTYSKVTVKNITAADDDETGSEKRKTRSGTVITDHYTSFDFPTITTHTNIDNKTKRYDSNEYLVLPNLVLGMFGLNIGIKNELAVAQGFYIETNDMNGKVKKQTVKDNANNLVSSVEYNYSVEANNSGNLNNNMTVIDKKGGVSKKTIGVDYDVVNDLRYNHNYSSTVGANGNLEVIPIPFWVLIIPTIFFDNESHLQTLRTAVTTKVVHKTGVMVEKVAYDLGSRVSTQNLAWDESTGQVLLTKTENEYDDAYYSLNFPAYWYYDQMGMASKNIDIRGKLKHPTASTETNPNPYFTVDGVADLTSIFNLGDELYLTLQGNTYSNKYWVFGFNSTNSGVLLMDGNGNFLDQCGNDLKDFNFRIFRSGRKNNQMAGMASITSMRNPIDSGNILTFLNQSASNNPKIINASAIEYKDFWEPQAEQGLKLYPNTSQNGSLVVSDLTFPTLFDFNPYKSNYKGIWRPVKSYAYLTGRKSVTPNGTSNPRHSGFFTKFEPFYTYNNATQSWKINNTNNNGSHGTTIFNWVNASEVTQYSPYGVELENRDALNRYSSAQYGYLNTLPIAVTSNAKYQQMGFDNFEDQIGNIQTHHFKFVGDQVSSIISKTTAHTGKQSIKVSSGRSIVLSKRLKPSIINATSADCITNPGGGTWELECVCSSLCNDVNMYGNYEAYYGNCDGSIGVANLGPGECVDDCSMQLVFKPLLVQKVKAK
jgi:hypothetical protein